MSDAFLAVPGDLAAPTGGYAYARRLLAALPGQGLRASHLALPGGFPMPTDEDLAATRAAFAALPPGPPLMVDGLAYGALPAEAIRAAGDRPLVALVHHPLCLEEGLSDEAAARLRARERAALGLAHRVVTTSGTTRDLLVRDFGVAAGRITVAEPGTDPAPPNPVRPGPAVSLLAVGTLIPRKGYAVLIEALAPLRGLDWTLAVAGALDRDPACAAAVREAAAAAGLGGRVRFLGAVDPVRLDRLYAEADLLVSASLFEGYGMALAEGLARGLPIIATTGGAAAATVPDAAGLKVPPGDAPALREALRGLVTDPDRRRAAACASRAAGLALPRWEDTAARVASCLREAGR
ncbi:glycosyl transferase group 1 [Methylobacterium sp. 4-46]|uniref:glycosyltransferase family 4 protein n=1 Tax=unclassified Methylobacterium TaxID=2615210 RepID=UPI000152CA5B|nr:MULTISPECIES: glycosyltransferase family 4 protein [Methylobacterium]ACA19115.1 glycosyl transferase group 1 [Methylobacterium sp. 4-46]WFT78326.1 glycosyltransferase family 4 protein [Methylobacterium nodulans]